MNFLKKYLFLATALMAVTTWPKAHNMRDMFDVYQIVKNIEAIPSLERTEEEHALYGVLTFGFTAKKSLSGDTSIEIRHLYEIAGVCQVIPADLMAYLLIHAKLDYDAFDSATALKTLDNNKNAQCESCEAFRAFIKLSKDDAAVLQARMKLKASLGL
jgi:hypothetical protein